MWAWIPRGSGVSDVLRTVGGLSDVSVSDNRLSYTYSVCVLVFLVTVRFRIGVPCKYSSCY